MNDPVQQPIRDLLLEIAHCPNVRQCLLEPNVAHPCAKIVSSQGSRRLVNHQVPGPWNGNLEDAPILFLSSNPSINFAEEYPQGSWSDDLTLDYFMNSFGGGQKVWVRDLRTLQTDGTYSKKVNFWIIVRKWTAEVMRKSGDDVHMGKDCVLSEVVHCKSKSELGVTEAVGECTGRYLNPLLNLAGAKVIFCVGKTAQKIISSHLHIPENTVIHGPVEIGDRARCVAFLPHPSRNNRALNVYLPQDGIEYLRHFMNQ